MRLGRGNHNFHYVHRLVALTFLNREEGKTFINHKDGNKLNNHYMNLEWCTNSENINHAWENGLSCKRKISDNEVNQIRELRANGVSYKDIASKFDIRRETASNIVNRKFRFGGDKDDTGSTSEIEGAFSTT